MGLKEKIGNYLLHKKLNNRPERKVAFNGTGKMQQVGIVFDATSFNDYMEIKNFEKELKKLGKSVSILGYSDTKMLHEQYISDSQKNFIYRKDFNWLNQCTNSSVDEFVHKSFDLLISLTPTYYFPIYYIEMLSMATFKVGRAQKIKTDFDLMLEMPEGTAIEAQVKETWRYLEMISQPQKTQELTLTV